MDKYIKVSDTISELNMYHMPETVGETGIELINRKAYNTMLEIAKMVVNAQPTADVAPVVHAHWIQGAYPDGCEIQYDCSHCNMSSNGKTNFCPHCGAKMDEEVKQ